MNSLDQIPTSGEDIPSPEVEGARISARTGGLLLALTVAAALLAASDLAGAPAKKASSPKGADPLRSDPAEKREENARVKAMKLRRFKDSKDLEAAIRRGELVRVVDTAKYYVNPGMGFVMIKGKPALSEEDRLAMRSLLPHTKALLDRIAAAFFWKFKVRLKITGLTRSEEYVLLLRESGNENVSMTSTHRNGCTFDLGYEDMPEDQRAWLHAHLKNLEDTGVALATRENDDQLCFHVVDAHADGK